MSRANRFMASLVKRAQRERGRMILRYLTRSAGEECGLIRRGWGRQGRHRTIERVGHGPQQLRLVDREDAVVADHFSTGP